MELKILEEETAKRIEEAIRAKVDEKLASDEVKLEIERRVEEGQKKLFADVEAQLEREKQAALTEARQKEVSTTTPSLPSFSYFIICFFQLSIYFAISILSPYKSYKLL